MSVNIVVVTTAKEERIPTTQDIVLEHLGHVKDERVRCIHYPKKHGYMAHQLNYAFEKLIEDHVATLDDYFVLYNADSHPHPQTFCWFFSIESAPDVVQQVAILFKNFNNMPHSFAGYVSKSFATLQTRWSLTHELPRMIANMSGGVLSKFKNANCIGHGLFIRGTILKENDLFSEDTMTEDLFLGFLLRTRRIAITPHPFMELAESPLGIISNIKQRIVWSWGSIMYPHYFLFFISKTKHASLGVIVTACILMLQGVCAWMRWLLSGLCVLLVAFYPLFSDSVTVYIFALVALASYGFLQYVVTLAYFPFLHLVSSGVRERHLSSMEMIAVSMFSYIAIVFHSVAGIIGLFQYMRYLATGMLPRKYKTGEDAL
jgi:hypothetical protein